MADTAGQLVDFVFPAVPIRQWVLTVLHTLSPPRATMTWPTSPSACFDGARDLSGPDEAEDATARDEAALSVIAEASLRRRIATGVRRGQGVRRMGWARGEGNRRRRLGQRCAKVEGFNLHANVRIAANDRKGVEALCRYLGRPRLSEDLIALPALPVDNYYPGDHTANSEIEGEARRQLPPEHPAQSHRALPSLVATLSARRLSATNDPAREIHAHGVRKFIFLFVSPV